MYQNSYGAQGQINFNNKSEYYQALGYLAKSDKTSIHWEDNDIKGTAWGKEGRIHFYVSNPVISGNFKLTAGTGNIKSRTNCNDFIKNIVNNHAFIMGKVQEIQNIRNTIPDDYLVDFDLFICKVGNDSA